MKEWLSAALAALSLSVVGMPSPGAEQVFTARVPNGLALTPPMGWNSWNKYGCDISEATIRRQADAMVSSGMRTAGYTYVVVDDCWHGQRDSAGNIQADPLRFAAGIKALADYVHAKGLKFGIYSDAGDKTCQKRPGSRGHEFQDSYVLGGRAMVIAYDEESVTRYMKEAVEYSHDRPVLIDHFLEDAIEVDVDAFSDGQDVVIGGIIKPMKLSLIR